MAEPRRALECWDLPMAVAEPGVTLRGSDACRPGVRSLRCSILQQHWRRLAHFGWSLALGLLCLCSLSAPCLLGRPAGPPGRLAGTALGGPCAAAACADGALGRLRRPSWVGVLDGGRWTLSARRAPVNDDGAGASTGSPGRGARLGRRGSGRDSRWEQFTAADLKVAMNHAGLQGHASFSRSELIALCLSFGVTPIEIRSLLSKGAKGSQGRASKWVENAHGSDWDDPYWDEKRPGGGTKRKNPDLEKKAQREGREAEAANRAGGGGGGAAGGGQKRTQEAPDSLKKMAIGDLKQVFASIGLGGAVEEWTKDQLVKSLKDMGMNVQQARSMTGKTPNQPQQAQKNQQQKSQPQGAPPSNGQQKKGKQKKTKRWGEGNEDYRYETLYGGDPDDDDYGWEEVYEMDDEFRFVDDEEGSVGWGDDWRSPNGKRNNKKKNRNNRRGNAWDGSMEDWLQQYSDAQQRAYQEYAQSQEFFNDDWGPPPPEPQRQPWPQQGGGSPYQAQMSPEVAMAKALRDGWQEGQLSRTQASQLLGTATYPTSDDVTRARKQLVLKYHPDRNPDDNNAATAFRLVMAASKVLG
mmetsp:Transcript_162548/g.521077  ORF Transcript_162548/g.521077 Transcript_162548/m.521077 type:complete len:580 (+) Transcript_162548:91-1830(+)